MSIETRKLVNDGKFDAGDGTQWSVALSGLGVGEKLALGIIATLAAPVVIIAALSVAGWRHLFR